MSNYTVKNMIDTVSTSLNYGKTLERIGSLRGDYKRTIILEGSPVHS